MNRIITTIIMTMMAAPAAAADLIPGPVPFDVVATHDGDTTRGIAQPWPGMHLDTSVRLRGVDTPELRAKCDAERQAAERARDRLRDLLAGGGVALHDVEIGKYAGRVVATVTAGGVDVAGVLIAEGLGRAYDGGRRQGWCG